MMKQLLWIALICVAPLAGAQSFTPPEQVTHSGKVYKLAFKQVAPNGRAIYEYTSDGEPVENWTRLITLNYGKGLNVTSERWNRSMKSSLDSRVPRPQYWLTTDGNNSYARFIMEPDRTEPTYESNIHKSFHLEKCGGLFVYQYAVKYKASADQSAEGKRATLATIIKENEQQAAEMSSSSWVPDCK